MNRFFKGLKNHFIPHKDNEFKPHFLRHESMLVVSLIVLIVELGFLVQVFVVFDNSRFLAAVLPGVLTSITNDERAQNNAPKLALSETLTRAATMKAQDMATKGYFAHTSPEGKTPWYWFNQVGYQYAYAGENLAVNFFESNDVAQAWMNSPTHRANIVKKDYTEIGIGIASGIYEGKETVFVAQLFGTPIKSSVPTTTVKPTETVKPTPVPTKTTTTKTPVKKAPTTSTPKVAPKAVTSTPTLPKVEQPIVTKVLSEETTSNQEFINNVKDHFSVASIKSFFQKILTSPRQSATYVLELIALIIFLSIILVHVIAYEKRHSLSIVRGLAVIVVIGSLLFMNFNLSQATALKLPTNNLEASIVSAGY
ncbi:MAG: CAP domain-containing protein [bacterium]|nr:CAP domain-containing protein [bacterium]